MAKRFSDTDSYSKPWFRKLSVVHKVAWDYCFKRCTAGGILTLDSELADFQIGEPVDWPEFFKACGDRILELPDGKYFLTTFVEFQYGSLSEDCNPHKAVINELKKHGLWEGYLKGIYTLQDKDKDKEQDKDQDRKGGAGGKPKFTPPTVDEVREYCQERKNSIDPEHFWNHYQANGWVQGNSKKAIKDWRACVVTWEKNNNSRGSPAHSSAPKGIKTAQEMMGELT